MSKEILYGYRPLPTLETSVITVDYEQAFEIWCRLRDRYEFRQRYVDFPFTDRIVAITESLKGSEVPLIGLESVIVNF